MVNKLDSLELNSRIENFKEKGGRARKEFAEKFKTNAKKIQAKIRIQFRPLDKERAALEGHMGPFELVARASSLSIVVGLTLATAFTAAAVFIVIGLSLAPVTFGASAILGITIGGILGATALGFLIGVGATSGTLVPLIAAFQGVVRQDELPALMVAKRRQVKGLKKEIKNLENDSTKNVDKIKKTK